MDGQTPEANTMPQQQPQQPQQANVSQNAQGFAGTTNLDASGKGCPVQRCRQGNFPRMQEQGPVWFGVHMFCVVFVERTIAEVHEGIVRRS